MTPTAIILGAAADGVILTLLHDGSIEAIGKKSRVNRWLSAIKAHKLEILAALSKPENDDEVRIHAWLERIGEHDLETIAAVIGSCRTDPAVLAGFLQQCDDVAVEGRFLPEVERICRYCACFQRLGLSAGYCGGRDDLPPAYGPGHPLRKLPEDNSRSCDRWEKRQ